VCPGLLISRRHLLPHHHAPNTSAVATFNDEDPLTKFDTVAGDTRRVHDFAVKCGVWRFLITCSGSVYGKQPCGRTHIPEDYAGAPDPRFPSSALGEANAWRNSIVPMLFRSILELSIARCFTVVGPHLQLDIHNTVGHFIRDALRGEPIRLWGDGTPRRSYHYVADLMVWLWTKLFRAKTAASTTWDPKRISASLNLPIWSRNARQARWKRFPVRVGIKVTNSTRTCLPSGAR
jgi:nucleoside-diphosphate-sugar epimerase